MTKAKMKQLELNITSGELKILLTCAKEVNGYLKHDIECYRVNNMDTAMIKEVQEEVESVITKIEAMVGVESFKDNIKEDTI